MKISCCNRNRVSKVIVALLLLTIAVGIFGVFNTYCVSGPDLSGESVTHGVQDSAEGTGKLMSLVGSQVQGNAVTLYLYNYGLQLITLNQPQQAFLVASGSQQELLYDGKVWYPGET